MTNTLRAVMIAGAAVLGVAGVTKAHADVIRVAVVVADSAADYQNNAALVPSFEAIMKKGAGVKAVYAGVDEAHMSITTTSVWSSEADANATTSSPDWKAAAGKLKSKSYTIGVFQLAP